MSQNSNINYNTTSGQIPNCNHNSTTPVKEDKKTHDAAVVVENLLFKYQHN